MTYKNKFTDFFSFCEQQSLILKKTSDHSLLPAGSFTIDPTHWQQLAHIAAKTELRWVSLWAQQISNTKLQINVCFARQAHYLIFQTCVSIESPELNSHTSFYPAANRAERHAQDMFGIRFIDHPDGRRWTRHQAWPENSYPLRDDFDYQAQEKTAGDSSYPFFQAEGNGVYEIPVGPIHAGIIEPGHFRFQAVGETVLNLEQRLAYVHKGIEKIAQGRDAQSLNRLAARISGDTTVAHSWAACSAMESAAQISPPTRALAIRGILAERERICNHLGDIGAICNDVGFSFAMMQCSRLREDCQRLNKSLFSHRLLMDCVIPGGVNTDLNEQACKQLSQQNKQLLIELNEIMPLLEDSPSLQDRLLATGTLSSKIAKELGVLGYMGKASGIDFDLRRDLAYAPYDKWPMESPCVKAGDVAARVQIRAEEIRYSLNWIQHALEHLPTGEICTNWYDPQQSCEGIGLIEAWRGEIFTYVKFDNNGRVSRFFPRDPSWLNWPALEQLIHGNIVPDFPVCNKSVNASYSGQDL